MHADLQRLKDEAQPVVGEMKNLVSTVRVGVIDPEEFQNRYTVKNAFTRVRAWMPRPLGGEEKPDRP